jgi:NADPH-dependent glutamate synthase beta subunit-like oxidoreductase/NAD(P)H-flavin reductase
MSQAATGGSEPPISRPPRSVPPPPDGTSREMPLGIAPYTFADLFDPAKLAALHADFDRWFFATAPDAHARFAAYAGCKGVGMTPEAVSEALLAAAPFVSQFTGRLFGVEKELASLRADVMDREPLWRFKRDFGKKRVLKDGAGKAWAATGRSLEAAKSTALAALSAVLPAAHDAHVDEELFVARATLLLFEIDETARKAAKHGGAHWTDVLRARVATVRAALAREPSVAVAVAVVPASPDAPTDAENAQVVALALDAVEAWLAHRYADHHDAVHRWASLRQPKNLDYQNLVELRRPDPKMPELFVGPDHERRERDGFRLTDRRGDARTVEQEIDYCLYCHNRDKDSCSKGLFEPKSATLKKNPLGVALTGCPLDEKISEMHTMRRDGDALGALSLVLVDNPMCPGTGHRICNDCMKACIFQKQEPVNIPQIETRVLTEVLDLPWGMEIFGFLTRWNPLNVARPTMKPYNGRNVLVVGLGPAGYTLAHHLACEGFAVVAVDGLKVEPLPEPLTGHPTETGWVPPAPIRDFHALATELDERILLGFGGVSEYGITVRWDKNFLTVTYVTLARNRNLRIFGGIRFGGTLTIEDAWALGFDHVAISAGAGRPTVIDMKNNLSRGIRKASDFLMGLQLTGAYKKSSIANLQIDLPAIVIGGGLTAIDTATELLAYYVIQIEKEAERFHTLCREKGDAAIRAKFDDEEWETLQVHLGHAQELAEERARAKAESREARVQELLAKWGGVTLVYRKALGDSPAYRLNHEEVAKSLEEGVRYVEHMSPLEAVLDAGGHVTAVKFARKEGEITLPARTVCVAAGTSPNVTYEKEYEGTFKLDAKKQYFLAHTARLENGALVVAEAKSKEGAFFTSYDKGGHTVSFYGDNHPHYAGSVVRAMASAKDGYPHVSALFEETRTLDPAGQSARDKKLRALYARLDDEMIARVVKVNRLTETIVEVVVHAPMAARKFKPGQFYRLQNFESHAPIVDGTRLAMEGLALTGAWIDEEKGLLGTIVLEMGGSSRLCAALAPGEPIVLMGPTGTPTEIVAKETVMLCGGGLGNAVLFSIARAFKILGAKVLYFAGYKRGEDMFKQDDIEAFTDQVIWCTDTGTEVPARRPQDVHFRGNIVKAMIAYGKGEIGDKRIPLAEVARIIAIGSDRMMAAVQEARQTVLKPMLSPRHLGIASINSPMQCMMKEVCAQCLQKHRDPETGREYLVFSCYNQDQALERVDFHHLRERLRANSMQEKISNAWLDHVLAKRPELLRV